MAHNLQHPTLVFVRGLPGSGKSYFANELQKAINNSLGQDTVVMLDPDATDYDSKDYVDLVASLSAKGVDSKFHPYRFLRARAHGGITSNKVIIWNQPFTNFDGFNKTVINLQAYAKEHKIELPIMVVEVETDHETAKARVLQRKQAGGHGPSDNTFERFKDEYASFVEKGFSTITVNGQDDVAKSVALVMEKLQLSP